MRDIALSPPSLPASSSACAPSSSVKRVRTYSRIQLGSQPVKRVKSSSPIRPAGHLSDRIFSDDLPSSPLTSSVDLPSCSSEDKDGSCLADSITSSPHSSTDLGIDSESISRLQPGSTPKVETNIMASRSEPLRNRDKTHGQMSLQSFFRPVSTLGDSPGFESRPGSESKSKLNQRPFTTSTPTSISKANKRSTPLQQTMLCPAPRVKTCAICQMTYQPLSPTDELTHRVHHRRVLEGLEWDDADRSKSSAQVRGTKKSGLEDEECWRVVQEDVEFGNGKKRGRGRVLVVLGRGQGKVGKKTQALHALIDSTLSSPPLPDYILDQTKTFLLLGSPISSSSLSSKAKWGAGSSTRSDLSLGLDIKKQVVLGALVVQQIKSAYRVLERKEILSRRQDQNQDGIKGQRKGEMMVVEPGNDEDGKDESDGGVFCDPTPLPTQLGIHRIHTAHSARRLGIASTLLDIACKHTIFGMQVTSAEGIAFSQPTRSGRALMERWGQGSVRVFIEDE
ncbi:Protein involved in establishing cohesion between sister chromatids during DNA replication [Phaffia rhodozyma]|uniref:Protein involved in establishing cohesion between sister chromatids during DNA replication n=1 Tax=Phaffia rhodozyma TaxID=264483 RepID=A0A0F7SQ40_PHARH|nr:Protein involved in establishing cohesion between sister chromatids during DNA replication [Phaffia rhodozyma]